MITPANRAIELKTRFQGEAGGGDPTKRKVKLRPPVKTEKVTDKVEPPTRSKSVNGQDVSQTGYYADQFNKILVEDVPTQGVNEKINEQIQKTPNLDISGVGQNLYPAVQDNTRQNIGTPINPKDPLAGEVQGGLLDSPAGKMLMDNLFMTGATKESTDQILQGANEFSNGDTSKGTYRAILGALGLTGAPFTALDQNAQNVPDIGQFVSGMSSLPFMLMGEAGKISNQKVKEFLGIKLADKEQDALTDEIAGVLAQFVIPMGIEGGVRKFGIKPEKLIEVKTKIDAIPPEIKTPENIKKVVQGLLPEGSKFKNTVDPQGNVVREKIPTGDLTSSPADKISESQKNIEQNPRFPEPLPKVDNYAGLNDLGATEKFDITKGLKSSEPSKKQQFKEKIEPELNHLLDLAKDPEDLMLRVQRQFPKSYEQIGNYLQDLGYTVEKGTKGLKEYFGRKPKEQINPKEEYINNLPEITPEEKTRAKDFVDLKREANLNLNSVGDLKLDTFEIRKGLNDIKKDVFDTKEAKLVTDKINQAYEKGISGNNDRGDFRKPNYMSPEEIKGLTEKPVEDLTALRKEYENTDLDKLVKLKKKLYSNVDITTPKSPKEKLLDEIVANKFSEKNQQIRERNNNRKVESKLPTLSEYMKQVNDKMKPVDANGKSYNEIWKKEHKQLVEKELKKGKTVPEEVLKDYPELQPEVLKPEVGKKRIVSDESYKKAKDELNKPSDRLSSNPIDYYAKHSKNLTTVGIYHLENGITNFKEWSKKLVEEFGDRVRPHLKKVWELINKDPDVRLKNTKVIDEKGNPLTVYSGHSNTELYGEYNPKKSTAGAYYTSESPEVASGYALSKFGVKEGFDRGNQYRFEDKSGKLTKKLWQIKLDDKQLAKLEELKKRTDEYGSGEFGMLNQMDDYIQNHKNSDKDVRRWSLTGGSKNLQNIYEFMEQMGDTIAYYEERNSSNPKPEFLRQRKNSFEDLLDELGIKWNSYDWQKPGVFANYLDIKNPLDAEKPFPQDLMKALEQKAKGERYLSDEEIQSRTWTSDYPLRQWIEDIKSGDEYWTTHVPKKAIDIIKQFGYDGIKELGLKGADLPRDQRQINWLAFDKEQIIPKAEYDYNKNVKVLKEALAKKSLDMSGLSKLVDLTDKKVLKATFEIAKYHFENGLNKFGDWARQIVKDTGNWIKPHLKELWKYANGEKSIMGTGLSLNVPPPKDRKVKPTTPDRIPLGEKESQFEYNPKTVHGDIEKIVRDYVKENIDKFKELRRGRITDEQLIKQATKIASNMDKEKAFSILRNGETLTAEEHLGVVGYTTKLVKDVLADKNSTPIEKSDALLLWAKSEAVSGELGRSLRARQLIPKLPIDDIKKLAEDVPEEFKQEIQKLVEEAQKDPENTNLMDKIRYYIYNAMLSRPLTHARNIVGNTSHLLYESVLTGDLPSVLRGLKRGGSKIPSTIKRILQEGGEISKFTEGKQYEPKNKYLRNAMPTTWLKIEDVVFKELSKGIETEIQGKQIGKELKVSPETVIKGIENVMKGESLKNPAVNERLIKAVDEINSFADYVTFQKELGVTGKKFQGMINSIPGGFLVVPFIRTPANILKVGLQPLKLLKFASKEYRAEFRDMTPTMKRKELTRMTAGAMTMGLLAYLTANGTIDVTGQGAEDKSKKDFMEKQGWKPNSVKIGDKYISYQNVNPFNVFLGILGNYSDGLKYNYRPKDDELNIIQKMSKTTAGFVQTVTDQSFLQGLSNLAKWQETKDPYYFEQFLQMPVPGVLSTYKDLKGDNTAYEQKTFGEKFSNRLGTTDGLKPRINVFGEPEKTSGTGLPIPTQETPDALSKLLLDNNVTISYPKKDIIKSDGQKVTDDEYYNFVKESGQRIKKKLDDNFETIKALEAGDMNDLIDGEVQKIRNDVKEEMFGKKEKKKTNQIKLK